MGTSGASKGVQEGVQGGVQGGVLGGFEGGVEGGVLRGAALVRARWQAERGAPCAEKKTCGSVVSSNLSMRSVMSRARALT